MKKLSALLVFVIVSFFGFLSADGKDIVIINQNVQSSDIITKALENNPDVYFVKDNESVISIVNSIRNEFPLSGQYQTIAIFTHGSDGQFELGQSTIANSSISAIYNLMPLISANTSLQIYACNVAQDEAGVKFVNKMAAVLHVTVSASTNITGKNGDWVLEYTSGTAKENNLINAEQLTNSYPYQLQSASLPGFSVSLVNGSLPLTPSAFGVDDTNGYIYYTDFNTTGTLSKLNVNGTNTAITADWGAPRFWDPFDAEEIAYYHGNVYTFSPTGNNDSLTLLKINAITGASSVFFKPPTYIYGAEAGIAIANDTIYCCNGDGAPNLYAYCISAHTWTLMMALPNASGFTQLKYNLYTNKLYYTNESNNLYLVSPESNTATLISSNMISFGCNFAIDPLGQYCYSYNGGFIYQISIATGIPVAFASGFSGSYIQDLDFAKASNGCGMSLYVSSNNAVFEIKGFGGITTPAIRTPICLPPSGGDTLTVGYRSPCGTFYTGNVFTAQLSDSSGNFGAFTVIGTVDSVSDSGVIAAIIPSATIPGKHYKIRVESSNIPILGSNDSNYVVIGAVPNVVANILANVSCNAGNNGSEDATVTLGQQPYVYNWSNSSTRDTAFNLTAGSYSITVTSAYGCSATATTIAITQPLVLSAVASTTANVQCNGDNNGNASSLVSGGTTPYTYAWSGGGNNSTLTGLTAGTYTLTVHDNNGCVSTASTIITQPNVLTASANPTHVLCNGGTGSAASIVSGGTTPYTYAWSGGGGTNSIASGLSAGTYSLSVIDNNGCSATASTTITQPTVLTTAASTVNDVSCINGSNGSAVSTVNGGASPYTYLWTGGGSNATVSGLTAGTYTLNVNDANGCTGTAIVTITQPNALSATATTANNVSCHGVHDGGISSAVSGGTAPFTYSWSPSGETTASAFGLTAGSYTLTVTDICGDATTASATITQPVALVVSALITSNVTCNGLSNGSASSSISGGTTPYTYSWSNGGSNTFIGGLTAGTYTLTVTDNNGCADMSEITITQPLALSSTSTVINVNSTLACNGRASVTPSGGTAPYTYKWSPGGGTNDSINGKCAGDYCCKVTDANGCKDSTCVTIANVTGIAGINSSSNNINVYPDPNNGSFTMAGVLQGQVIELYNYMGQKLSSTIADNSTMHFNISNQPNGIYMYRVLSEDGTLVGQGKLIIQK